MSVPTYLAALSPTRVSAPLTWPHFQENCEMDRLIHYCTFPVMSAAQVLPSTPPALSHYQGGKVPIVGLHVRARWASVLDIYCP
jgi:hypothetical protein